MGTTRPVSNGDPEKDSNAASPVLDRYWETNSMSGLTHIRISSGKKRRFFWMFMFMVGITLTVACVTNAFRDYFNYSVITKVIVMEQLEVEFPSVTICNLNQVHCGNLFTTIAVSKLQLKDVRHI
jgi:hypothetical protein